MSAPDHISKKEEKFLKKLGFKKVWASDKSCFWFDMKMKNQFFRKGVLTIEPGMIIASCLAPKIIEGISHDTDQYICAMENTDQNLYEMLKYFCSIDLTEHLICAT